MKSIKCINLILISITFIACTRSVKRTARTPSSHTTSAIEGVIKNVSCDPASGMGIMQLQSRVQSSLKATWYRINSKDLCRKSIQSQVNGHIVSSIVEISALNSLNEELVVSSITLDADDYVIDIKAKEKISSKEFIDGISYFEESNSTNSHYWYFNDVLEGSR